MVNNEVWKDVHGFPEYSVSSRGRVMGKRKTILKPSGLYPQVQLRRDGKTFPGRVHRLVARAFLGECPLGQEVCHNDGNRQNNRVSNLRYDTHGHNISDAYLSEGQVLCIREAVASGMPCPVVAQKVGTSTSTVHRIATGKGYRFFGGPITVKPVRYSKRLTRADVLEIRRLRGATSLALHEIGARFGVCKSHVGLIVRGRRRASA